MFEEEIIVSLLISIFALCLHYYIGTIDLWYIPAVEIFIAIVFYELIKAMYKSYKTYEDHNKTQQKARQYEFNLITDINTNENSRIVPTLHDKEQSTSSKTNKKNITFDKSKEVRYFNDDENLFDTVEVTNGKEEQAMSDTSITDTDNDDIVSLEEEFTTKVK
jgi:lipoprotein-anchoring transpeptidase ErfK/SrfK